MDALVYVSDERVPFDEPALRQLGRQAANANANRDITGYLNYKKGRFFQYLEGPAHALDAVIARIRADERHAILRELRLEANGSRTFASWHMRYLSAAEVSSIRIEDLLDAVLRSMASPTFDEATTRAVVLDLVRQVARYGAGVEHDRTRAHLPSEPAPSEPTLVVGIGASAGGLLPLQRLFKRMPATLGAAFVVVQHLAPNNKSLMDEILQRQTTMRVAMAGDDTTLEPNVVYLIPPSMNLEIARGRFQLSRQERRRAPEYPIDIAFRSMAQEYGDTAFGIILSGTGTDGSRGAQALASAGGTVLVQSPESAEFDGMPRATIETGVAHRVMDVESMVDIVAYFVSLRGVEDEAGVPEEAAPSILARIVALISDDELDLRQYKLDTLARRIERRRLLSGSDSLDDYESRLRDSAEERAALRGDMMISVTAFFRDPSAWELLKRKVLPEVIDALPDGDVVRAWVAGCASGEEAYSLAIVLAEALAEHRRKLDFKIFATDVDKQALEQASTGVYSLEALEEVDQARQDRYFFPSRDGLAVTRELRDRIIFAPQNVAKDAPFTRLHLVTCRNVLIYMQPSLQEHVLRTLQFALQSNGVLFLGSADSLGGLKDDFHPLDRALNVHRKIAERKGRPPVSTSNVASLPPVPRPRVRPPDASRRSAQLYEASLRLVADSVRSTFVVVDDRRRTLLVIGDPERLLETHQGEPTLDIAEMVPRDIAAPLTSAIQRAASEREVVQYRDIAATPLHGDPGRFALEVRPAAAKADEHVGRLLVRLERAADPADTAAASLSFAELDVAARAEQLERELQETRETLQSVIEELESSNEEQQTTNEELTASNEELQSTNEELQSVNEELYTINFEYQSKIHELSDVTNDLDNLLASTNIGVVYLDEELRIRRFTPNARRAVHLMDSDVGRPFQDLSHNLDYQSLVDDMHKVLSIGKPVEHVATSRAGGSLLIGLHPYVTGTELPQGLVVTFIDTTS